MSQSPKSSAPETCAFCKGAGEFDGRRCPACDGRGEVNVAQPAKRCALCNGTGRLCIRGCPACGGTGWTAILRG
ncbi:MAG TPA: transcriptional regulator [Methanotrichaceae archaeon]|nr:transcriptional regulator [Methanotrichaceae archaeon]